MSKPFEYFAKRNQMSAILKQDLHRLRSTHPTRLSPKNRLPVLRLNKAGDSILSGVTLDKLSTPMSPRDRHALAWRKE